MKAVGPVRVAIVIPALDEEEHLPATLRALPSALQGVDEIDVIVVDDGSGDRTAEVAIASGAHHVVRHHRNLGLARAFVSGISSALERGATHVVHTDADGQYDGRDIPLLLGPILDGRADLVVGARPIAEMAHFSRAKRVFQRLGSRVVGLASGYRIPDAPSGFRAMSAETCRRLHVHGSYSYTLETLIQAGRSGLRVISVPIHVNGPSRPSRLMRSWLGYVRRSALTIVRIAVIYRPFRFFAGLGVAMIVGGVLSGIWVALRPLGGGDGGVAPALVAASALVVTGVQTLVTAFLADAVAANRRLTQRLLELQLEGRGASRRGDTGGSTPTTALRGHGQGVDEIDEPG